MDRARGPPRARGRCVPAVPFCACAARLECADAVTQEMFTTLLTNARLVTMREGDGYGIIEDGALGIRDGLIAWVGAERDVPRDVLAANRVDAGRRWATPGLVDCHTHLVYAGNRASEFERRLEGVSYAEIAAAGGGIQSTVKATRAATPEALAAASAPRLAAMTRHGMTTVEIKSGYG